MKKLSIFICLFILFPVMGYANPMFGAGDINSVALYLSQGIGPGNMVKMVYPPRWGFSPMTNIMVQYSQPVEILRLPSRINVSAVQNFGYGAHGGLNFSAVGLSWDIALVSWCGFYLGAGVGPYMRNRADRYVGSRLVAGEKFFIGKNIGENFRAEIYTLHFSNGDLAEPNRGFNFAGLAGIYSF